MKKYIYIVASIVVLTIVVGFTSRHLNGMHCTETVMFTDLAEAPIDSKNLQGQGVFQELTTDLLYTDIRVANYQLAAGSYFNWQSLPGGRVLMVTEGEGYYQSKGKEAIAIRKGDRIETIPGLYHWVGAAPDSQLTFISVTSQKSSDLINWHEAVSAEEYHQVASIVNK
ncbi:cupin domain-containing protein [Sphingobacterium tabacisoli]|uniref:Cupin domain-containing protein n=1 Tax=Sphingobacterium tabacisoli TaxID=2044855 RepID=A0ABW5L8R2_9SPHI|nr:hypothetical protein [Sphingobacterium tabacisoli]